jgi:hypothetical protein
VDGIFGSNETSRAIASIITLVHRELMKDPHFSLAKAGRLAILAGLTKALTVFAILQNMTHKRTIVQIPSTILWQGLVEHDSEDLSPLSESKKRHTTTTNKKSHELIAQDIKTTLGHTKSNNMYKIATTSTCITTRTTFISPIDQSTPYKKITSRTSQEETQAFLAVVNQNPKKIILTKVPEKHERRKVEQRQQTIEQPQMTVEKNSRSSRSRRYSFPQQLECSSKLFEKGKDQSHCKDTIPATLFMRPSKSQTYKRRPSIDYHRPQRSNSIACSPTFQMTVCTPSPIPSPSLSTTSQKEDISYYEHGWNFPRNHIINNIAHFMRYASAAYGESFMRILGIGNIPNVLPSSHHHHPNHHAFAHHTGNSVEDILLSSYTGRSPLHLHNPSMHALVHYVTVDHAAKAIVLTCRGTLGLSDVLTDLNCEYSEFTLPSEDDDKTAKKYKAHSGMLDAAQLLAKEKGKVYRKIRQGLENYPDYGLVMCGHSLGASVVSLLSVLWSERKQDEGEKEDYFSNQEFPLLLSDTMPSFVTSRLSGLPAGRPIHCYAYGPPGVMDLELSQYCAGLVTTVVHGNDVVATLSLGILKDFKNIATSLHLEQEATEEIINRVVGRMRQKSKDQEEMDDEFNEDDQWFWAMIKTMRADMTSEKMYPPNTVYLIEAIPQTEQDKIVLSRCDDVEARFSELLFSRTMFIDHSPLMYERSIRKLCKGYFGDQEAYEKV